MHVMVRKVFCQFNFVAYGHKRLWFFLGGGVGGFGFGRTDKNKILQKIKRKAMKFENHRIYQCDFFKFC